MEDKTLDKGLKNAIARGFGDSLSAYIAFLISRDQEGKDVPDEAVASRHSRRGVRKKKANAAGVRTPPPTA